MCALLLELAPDDEVIVPSFTFVSSANAFALMGARIIFSEIDRITLGISMNTIRPLLTDRTKAVVVVNYAGIPALSATDITELQERQIAVIEDNAHGLFGSDADGLSLGTRSDLSTLSFHETKNISCGEGGALVINNPRFLERAEIIREKGTNRTRFFRGMVDKYTWVDKGSSYLMSEFCAAVLNSQLDFAIQIQERRRTTATYYAEQIATTRVGLMNEELLLRNLAPGNPNHMFYLLTSSLEQRTHLLQHLKAHGVTGTFHYVPLHSSPAGRQFGMFHGDLEVTQEISDRIVRLPLFSDITTAEAEQVVQSMKLF
jgi:dTDP-4-amino-4,6-dideoxygalactose transaminase